jgi:hypothetical protein
MPTIPCASCGDGNPSECCDCDCERRTGKGGCKYTATVTASGSFTYIPKGTCPEESIMSLSYAGSINGKKQLTFPGGTENFSLASKCGSSKRILTEDCAQDSDCCDETFGICVYNQISTGSCGQGQGCSVSKGPKGLQQSNITISPGPTSFSAGLVFLRNKQFDVGVSVNLGNGLGFFPDPNGKYSFPVTWPGGSKTLKMGCALSGGIVTFSGSMKLT